MTRDDAVYILKNTAWLGTDKDLMKVGTAIDKLTATGHWINEGVYGEGHSMCSIRCSECDWHYIGYLGDYNFCPNCGKKMEVGRVDSTRSD